MRPSHALLLEPIANHPHPRSLRCLFHLTSSPGRGERHVRHYVRLLLLCGFTFSNCGLYLTAKGRDGDQVDCGIILLSQNGSDGRYLDSHVLERSPPSGLCLGGLESADGVMDVEVHGGLQ